VDGGRWDELVMGCGWPDLFALVSRSRLKWDRALRLRLCWTPPARYSDAALARLEAYILVVTPKGVRSTPYGVLVVGMEEGVRRTSRRCE
jgi:hypothetical protein